MSVRNSMYRITFALIVIPFLLFSLLITQIYSRRLERVITESLSIVANAQVEEMTNFCRQQKEYLELLGTTDMTRAAMRGELSGEMHLYLDNILFSQVETISSMKTIAVIDKAYRVVACSKKHDDAAAEGIKSLIEKMGNQPFYISDSLVDRQGNKTLVEIARIEEDENLLGYVFAEIGLDFYSGIRERAKLWNESTFYLLDGNQQIISAGTPEEQRDSFISTEKDREDYVKKYNAIDFAKNPKGSFQYKLGGKDYITYYSDVEYTDWRVLLSVNMDYYQAQRIVYFVLTVFLLLLCALLAIWTGRFASKRIVRPIKRISGTLRDIQKKQDYALRVQVERNDELGHLGGEINELIDFIETEDLYKTQQQRLLKEKAEQDALTKVFNKEWIQQHLEDMVARRQGMAAILFVDIDDFKSFNTKYGHSLGDQVLLFITSVLTKSTGGAVGRVGGDEFLVIMESPLQIQDLNACLEKVEESAKNGFVIRGTGTSLPVYCSIGAVRVDLTRPNDGLTAERLINLADAAMYKIKNNGKHSHIILDYEAASSELLSAPSL